MSVKYSIVIPVYNAEKTINQCVKSIENQLSDYEIILVNDGSNDQSLNLCQELSKQNTRIKTFSIENQGQSVARNVGIEQCEGEFIHFLDSDDFWLDDSFRQIEDFMMNYDELDLIVFTYKIFDQTKNVFRDIGINNTISTCMDGKTLLFDLLSQNSKFDISPCRCFIRRSFLVNNELYFQPDLFFEDAKWMFETFLFSMHSIYMNTPLFGYRKSSSNQSITSSHSCKKISDRFHICEYWLSRSSEIDFTIQQRMVFLKRISDICFTGLIGIWSISDEECRHTLIKQFKTVEPLLNYPNSKMNKICALVCRYLGVQRGSYLFYLALMFKQKIKEIDFMN